MSDGLGRLDNGNVRRRRYAPRTKAGCLPCKTRHKRCPGEMPACHSCIRLNIECYYGSKRRLASQESTDVDNRVRTQAPSTSVTPEYSSAPLSLIRQPSPVQLSDRQGFNDVDPRILMSYYIHSFVPKISVINVPSNFFTSAYVPMAFQCPALLDAIVACASSHLAKAAADATRRDKLFDVSAKCQLRCYQFLQDRISLSGNVQRDPLEAMTIILLLIGLEVQNGARTPKWIDQLDCIRNIIRQHGGKAAFCSTSWEAECAYQHFLYHDVMSLIMSGVTGKNIWDEDTEVISSVESPAVPSNIGVRLPWDKYISDESQHDANAETATSRANPSDEVHPLLGLSRNLFFLIQKIRQVQVQSIPSQDDFLSSYEDDLFLSLEGEIISLKFELYPAADGTSAQLDASSRLDLITLAETYRLAALILLYRRSAKHSSQLPLIAKRIISLVQRIPSGNAAEAGLTYPLFLAGAELIAEDDILMCATKLINIRKRVNVMNIQSVEAVLEEVWRGRLNGEIPMDWEHILRDWQWVINLG